MSRFLFNTLALVGGILSCATIVLALLTAPRYVSMGYGGRWGIEALVMIICVSALYSRALLPREHK